MKTIKRLLALILCMVLAVGAAACNTQDTSWVYKAGEDTMPAGVYIMYLIEAYSEAEEKYMDDTYADAGWDEVWIYPTQDELLSSEIDGIGAAVWIQTKAQERVSEYYGAKRLASELNHTLSETGVITMQYNKEMTWTSEWEQRYDENGVAEASFDKYLENQMLKSELFDQIYGVGGSKEFPESEVKTILVRDYTMVSLMEFQQEVLEEGGEQAVVDTKNTELRELAESYGQRLVDGEQVDMLLFEYWLNNADDSGTVTAPEKEKWQAIFLTESVADYGENSFYDAIFATEIGSYNILDEDGYYTVIYRHDLNEDQETIEKYRTTIALQEKSDEFSATLTEKAAELAIEVNQPAVDRYTADKLKLS